MARPIISILIILSLLSPFLVRPEPVNASVLGTGVSFSSCAAAGYLSGLISKGLAELEKWVKEKLKNFIKTSIVGAIGGKVPVSDSGVEGAVNNFKGAYSGKENIQDLIARCAAREILTKMGRDITNVARTGGRDGGPAFVRNWRNFETDAGYRGEEIFRNMLASTRLCDHFASNVKNLFGVQVKKNLGRINTRIGSFDSFQLEAGCTMPAGWSMDAYKQDFEGNGGWDAWNRLFEPQNNFYGVLLQSQDEANKQRALEKRTDINEALSNNGYTSIRGRNALDSCSVRGANGKCIVYKDIKTPGSLIAGAVIEGVATELQWVASTDELNELIATGIQVLVNRLFDLSNPEEGDYIVPGDPTVSISPFPPPAPTCNAIEEDEGATERYKNDVLTAINQFLNANPEVADSPNDDAAMMVQYMEGVASILSGMGYASGRVINCNNNISSDSIYVGLSGDLYGDYYDLTLSAGSGETIRNSAQALFIQWAGSERLVGGGGGPGGGNPGGEPASLESELQAEINKYTLPTTPEQQGQILNAVAWNNRTVGWVLLGKEGGNNCPSPGGSLISCDYLVHQPTMYGYDVFCSEGAPDMRACWQGPDTGIAAAVARGSRSLVPPVQP